MPVSVHTEQNPQGTSVATAPPPVPPPFAHAAPLRRIEVPAWATSFGVHCLAIILLGLYTFREDIVGTRGLSDVALSWQEPSGEEQFDLDSGARTGEAEAAVVISADSETAQFSTWATDRFAELVATPDELQLELPGSAKRPKSILELSGLLGAGKANSGQGTNSGKGHGYGRTQFFGLEAEGNKFVYVFDRSHSMNSYDRIPLQAAKEELLSSIEHLQDQQQFYIVFYNHEPRPYEPPGYSRGRLNFATSENKDRLRELVYSLRADGGTRHVTALEHAVRHYKPDVIFLLTDGEDKDDLTNQELQNITRMNSGGASIHVIQFATEPRPASTLVQLAKRNRGKHTFIDLRRLAERIAAMGDRN